MLFTSAYCLEHSLGKVNLAYHARRHRLATLRKWEDTLIYIYFYNMNIIVIFREIIKIL